MSDNEIESDEMTDDFEEEELSNLDKKTITKAKMESKRKLEEYFENRKLEQELSYFF